VRLLLDTHALLWWLADDPRLGAETREAVADSEVVLVSTASAWEIALKKGLGKLTAPDDLPSQLVRHQFTVLPIHLSHTVRYGDLPLIHRDPFDRMLVAQAQVEGLTIVSGDPAIAAYDVDVLFN
jgi:PIN domain nuclease of toxin-antitoxin system